MSKGIVSVNPDSSLRAICSLMVQEHIHRVPVLERRRLVGIITTLDIVRCIAGVRAAHLQSPAVPRSEPRSPVAAEKAGPRLRNRRRS